MRLRSAAAYVLGHPVILCPAMYSHPSVTTLRDSLAAVAQARGSSFAAPTADALRAQVCAVVDEMKAAGWLPERVIIAVKQIAEDAGLRPSRELLLEGASLSGSDITVISLVRWCIERYYGVANSRLSSARTDRPTGELPLSGA